MKMLAEVIASASPVECLGLGLLLPWAVAIPVVVAVAIFSIGGPTELLY